MVCPYLSKDEVLFLFLFMFFCFYLTVNQLVGMQVDPINSCCFSSFFALTSIVPALIKVNPLLSFGKRKGLKGPVLFVRLDFSPTKRLPTDPIFGVAID